MAVRVRSDELVRRSLTTRVPDGQGDRRPVAGQELPEPDQEPSPNWSSWCLPEGGLTTELFDCWLTRTRTSPKGKEGSVKLKTQGIAPKTIVAAGLPLIAGIALALIDKLAAGDSIDDTLWWTLLGSSPLLGGGTYVAPAAPVAKVRVSRKAEAGYGVVEADRRDPAGAVHLAGVCSRLH
jgi:hypothetical protein